MFYRIVRLMATIWLKLSFKKIYFHGADLIPKDKPVILAANHPTAFTEPCLLACLLESPLYFMVRGDVFAKPRYARILKALHLVPVFRLKDGGYKKLKNNFSSFDFCFKALKENKTILILAEGSTIHEKRLRPLKKGTARLAFGTLERYPDLDVHIVPVGVNYEYADQMRSDVMFEFGPPIRVQDYKALHEEHPAKATQSLLHTLEERLRERIVIIDKPEDEAFTEQLLQLYRNSHPSSIFPIQINDNSRLQAERLIAQEVNQQDDSTKAHLQDQYQQYNQALERLNVQDVAIAQPARFNLLSTVAMIAGLIPFLIGFSLNAIPYLLATYVVKRYVHEIEYRLSVFLSSGMILYLIYWSLALIPTIMIGQPIAWLIWLLLPALGYFATLYYEQSLLWLAGLQLSRVDKNEVANLRNKRQELIHLLEWQLPRSESLA